MNGKKLEYSLSVTTVLLLVGFMFYFFYGTPWDLFSYKSKFETYLEDKYNKDFNIQKVYYDFFHGGTYHASAHAKDESDLIFYVGQNPYTKKIEDGYHFESWKMQANEELGPIIENFFPDRLNYSVETYPKNNLDIYDKPHIPNFKEYTTVDIGVSMAEYEVTDKNKDCEINRSYLLLITLKEEGINFSRFGVSYKNKTLQLQPADILSIKSAKDLEKVLNNYRQ